MHFELYNLYFRKANRSIFSETYLVCVTKSALAHCSIVKIFVIISLNVRIPTQKVLSRGVKDGYNTAKVQWIKDSPIPEEKIGNSSYFFRFTTTFLILLTLFTRF